ncbi:MAG: NAD-dependent epimerase/dehydratase family protein, partial [Ekhidna sp.]
KGVNVKVYDKYKPRYCEPLKRVEYYYGDFCDIAKLTEALNGVDLVIHLVSSSIPASSNVSPAKDIENNLIGTINLIEAMKYENVRKIIYFSSGGTVYGNPSQLPAKEESELNPISSYGIVKVSIESYLRMYGIQDHLEAVILRPSNPYGRYQNFERPLGIIPHSIFLALMERPVEIWGDGTTIRDFIYIDDLVALVDKIIDRFIPGTYNVGSGIGNTINEVLDIVDLTLPHMLNRKYLSPRGYDVRKIVLDIDKVAKTFNWSPKVSLEEGIRKTNEWIHSRLDD